MDPIIGGALISGGASLLGGAASSLSSAADSRRSIAFTQGENRLARDFAWKTTQANFEENNRNRKFQENMANTAYQRAVQDMRTAGINPMLAYQKGGADSPSGSSGGGTGASTSSNADIKETAAGEGLMRAAGSYSAMDAKRLANETSYNDAAIAAKKSEAALNLSNAASVAAGLPKKQAIGKVIKDVADTVTPAWDAAAKTTRKALPAVGGAWRNGTVAGKLFELLNNSGKGK